MIFTLLLLIFAFILQGIINVLPVVTIPTDWVSAVYYYWAIGNSFSYVFPVNALLFWLGVVLVFEVSILSFGMFGWLIRKIPGVS